MSQSRSKEERTIAAPLAGRIMGSAENDFVIAEWRARVPKQQLREVGWSKATELVKVVRREGDQFDCATWLHKARELAKEDFKWAVERHLAGKETEPWEIIYFKAYKSQLRIIERALATAALMLGSDKSRGYCLEMICADFLAGAALEADAAETSAANSPQVSPVSPVGLREAG